MIEFDQLDADDRDRLISIARSMAVSIGDIISAINALEGKFTASTLAENMKMFRGQLRAEAWKRQCERRKGRKRRGDPDVVLSVYQKPLLIVVRLFEYILMIRNRGPPEMSG